MKSSFTKSIKKTPQEKIFFGHPELDGILSNSIKKGSLILIEEDMPTTIHVQFLRYFIGVGIHSQNNCMVYDIFPQKWVNTIPNVLRESKLKKNEESEANKKTSNQIAWRYDSQNIKLKQLNSMISKDIIKLDLSKTHKDESDLLTAKNINEFKDLHSLYLDICETLQNTLSDENDTKLKRIQITNLFGHFSKIKYTQIELVKFLQALKALCRASHVLLVLTIPQALDQKLKNLLHFYFDIVAKIETLFEREELEHFNGIFHFLKISNISNFQNYKIETLSWGIKASSKRKLEIDRLYLAPEREQNQVQNTEQDPEKQPQQQQQQQQQSGKVDF